MGRVPRRARERGRRAAALVAQRPAAAALLPGAPAARRAAAAPLGARRRDRDRYRRSDRLRRDADAPPPGREPHPQALGRDPGAVHRLRRARLGRARRRGSSRSRSGAPRSSGMPPRFDLSPSVADPETATAWLDELELLGLDGVVAKRLDRPVEPGGRGAVVKVKPERTADCVVVGVRWKSKPDEIATLLLGLYDDDGEIDYVGSAAVAASRTTRSPSRCCRCSTRRPTGASRSRTAGAAAASRSSRCAPSSSPRCATTRCRARASGTARSCCGSGPTRIPASCTWAELRPPREPAGSTRRRTLLGRELAG